MRSVWEIKDGPDVPRRKSLSKPALVLSLGILILAGLSFLWYHMNATIDEVDEANIPVITNDQMPIKVKPENPGGYIAPHGDKSIYNLISQKNAPAKKTVLVQNEDEELLPQVIKVEPAAEEAIQPMPSGLFKIQLASLSSRESAQKEWVKLQKKSGDLLKNLVTDIGEATVNNATVFRIYGGSFATKQEADSLCEQLKTKGLSCFSKKV
ncbi:MAG: SPOR domain-containing protein [Alphaproteobacteria bacterium]